MENTMLQDKGITLFVDSYLQVNHSDTSGKIPQITWRDMQYLWKLFLDSNQLPGVIFQEPLKPLLIKKLSEYYNVRFDSFQGISSNYLPPIQLFLTFWQETISYEQYREQEYEIGEICFLMKKWGQGQGEGRRDQEEHINKKQLLDLLSYFFPRVEVEQDKYIYNIKCSLWDKQMDIETSLRELKRQLQDKYIESPPLVIPTYVISIHDAYTFYCEIAMKLRNTNEQIVTQSYFSNYVFENLSDFLLLSKYISPDWIVL